MYTSPTSYSGVPQLGMPTRVSSTVRNPFGSLSPSYATSYSPAPQSLGQQTIGVQQTTAPLVVSSPVGQQVSPTVGQQQVFAPQQTFSPVGQSILTPQGYVSAETPRELAPSSARSPQQGFVQQSVGVVRPPTPTAVVTTPLVPIEQGVQTQTVPQSLSQSPTLFSRPPSMRATTPLVPSIPVEQAVVSDTSESTLTTPVLVQVPSTPASATPAPAPSVSQVSFTPVGSSQPSFVSPPVALPAGSPLVSAPLTTSLVTSPQRALTPTLQSALGNPGITSPTPQRVTLTPSGSPPTSQPQIVISSPTPVGQQVPSTVGQQALLQQQALSYGQGPTTLGQTSYGQTLLQQPSLGQTSLSQQGLSPYGQTLLQQSSLGQTPYGQSLLQQPSLSQQGLSPYGQSLGQGFTTGQQILTPQGYVSAETGVRSPQRSLTQLPSSPVGVSSTMRPVESSVQLVSPGVRGPITGLTPLGAIQVTTPQTVGTTTVVSQTTVPVIATPPSPPIVPVSTTTQIIPPTPLSFAKGSSETLVAAPLSEVGPLMGGRSTPTETVAQGSIENELLAKGYTPISRIAVNQGQDIKGVYIKAVSPIGTIVYIALDAGGILSVTRSDIAETKVGGATSIPYSSKIAAAQCAGLAVCGIAYECKEGVCTLTTDDQGVAKEDLFITTASRSQSIGAFAGDLLPYPIVRLSDIRAAPEQTLENIREVASAIRAKARERLAKDVLESDQKAKALAAALSEYKERSSIVNDKLQRNLVYLSNLRLTYRGLAESGQLARNPQLLEKAASVPHELKHKQDIYTELLRQDVDMATINAQLDELLAKMNALNATAKIWECSADKRASKEGECVV